MNKVVHSRKSDNYSTPSTFFGVLDDAFLFGLDPAASPLNAKCAKYFTEEDNGLGQSWEGYGPVFCNPPYSRVKYWAAKAWHESRKGVTVVMLLAARTDTKAFHDFIYEKRSVWIWFVRGRLKFGGEKNSAPFPSMVVVFEGNDINAKSKLDRAMYAWEKMKGVKNAK